MKKILMTAIAMALSMNIFASVVTIEGRSVIVPNDPEKTRQLALDSALQKAVEAYVVTRVTKPAADASYAKLQPALYAPYKDFISKYEIVAERDSAEFHYVEVRAEIDDAKVNGQLNALGIQPGAGGKPKVAVLASEQNVDGTWAHSYYGSIFAQGGDVAIGEANFNICEGAVINAVSGAGFPVIDMTLDPTEVRNAYKYKPVFDRYDENMLNIPNDNASKLARVVDADVGIVITCSALAKSQGKKSAHMNSVLANVTCKAVNVKGNTRMASASASSAAPHIDPITGGNQALAKACAEVAQKIVTALTDRY